MQTFSFFLKNETPWTQGFHQERPPDYVEAALPEVRENKLEYIQDNAEWISKVFI